MSEKLLTRMGVSYRDQQKILIVLSVGFFIIGGIFLGQKILNGDISKGMYAVPFLTGLLFLYSGLKNPPKGK